MQVIKLSLALTTLVMGQISQVMAGEAKEYKIIYERPALPAAKPKDSSIKLRVGDFGTARTYPATSKPKVITPSTVETRVITGPLKKQ